MKKMYKPFWSYDVTKTEQWLSKMASSGLTFVGLNRWTRCFYFNETTTDSRIYRIAYDKSKSPVLPKTLQAEGWKATVTAEKWQITTNNRSEQTIRNFPTRDGVIKHNQTITYLFYGLLFYLISVLIAPISLAFSYFFTNEVIVVEESPYWIVTYLFFALVIGLIALGIYSIIKITKTNNALKNSLAIETITKPNNGNDKEAERQLKRSGRWVTKVRLGWMYSPDKLEKWLESMEQRGFNLYRVSKIGTVFHFTKDQPRRIAYRVDYQRQPLASYFAIHKEAGWRDCFVSCSNLENWTIWSQEYMENQQRPQLYSDNPTRIKHARKMVLTYTAFFLPFTLLYLFMLTGRLNQQNVLSEWLSWGTAVFILCIVIYGSFLVRIWTYYIRLKKQATV